MSCAALGPHKQSFDPHLRPMRPSESLINVASIFLIETCKNFLQQVRKCPFTVSELLSFHFKEKYQKGLRDSNGTVYKSKETHSFFQLSKPCVFPSQRNSGQSPYTKFIGGLGLFLGQEMSTITWLHL